MTVLITMLRTHWIIITLLLLAVITLLSLTPSSSLPAVPGNDKIHHFIAYCVLMFLVALKRPRYQLLIGLFLICWSGGIELLQPYVNRHSDWYDVLANGAGIGCGILYAQHIRACFAKKPIKEQIK